MVGSTWYIFGYILEEYHYRFNGGIVCFQGTADTSTILISMYFILLLILKHVLMLLDRDEIYK